MAPFRGGLPVIKCRSISVVEPDQAGRPGGQRERDMKRILAGAFALALFSACSSAPETTIAADGKPRAKVASGVLAGEMIDGIATWKGVPFAAAPVGELRWKAPQPVAAWQGERAANAYGPSCSQNSRLGAEAKVSEDCLYLNVYAPQGAKNTPVMVWIHGGSNLNGSGSVYNGAAFAKSGVVMVTINYRMGAFGFFAHPELTKAAAKDEPLANYGLMDQTAALQWVQKNIASFGGDPGKVTIFGESAGAIDIYGLLGLKTSKGLFDKAILESNITWGDSAPLADAEKDGVELIKRAGAEGATLAAMRALPADKLVAAAGGARFPIVDGRFMTESSISAMANKHTVDVPIIVGSNSYEASLSRQLQGQAQTDYTDNLAGAPARYIARQSADGRPSWLYFFSYVATARRTPDSPGAAHASEIPYVFGGQMRPADAPPAAAGSALATAPTQSEEDKAMAALMHSCWVAFARTGEPKCASGPAWPKYTSASDQLMEFGSPAGVRTNFRKASMDKWTAEEKNAK
jgi:para-nitrobenzyl esterase